MSKRAGESFATSASATQKPVHCAAMIATPTNDKNAHMDYHAAPPPEYRAGGDSKSEDLCQQDSQRAIKLLAASVGMGEPSSEKDVHLQANADGESYIRKFNDLVTTFKPQSEEDHEFLQSVLGLYSLQT